jgi:hypothetical protein
MRTPQNAFQMVLVTVILLFGWVVALSPVPVTKSAIVPDSIQLVGKWARVAQANDSPATYRAYFVRLAPPRDTIMAIIATIDTTAIFTTLRPPAGDTARWQLRVRSIDVRGDSSLLSVSPIIVIRSSWLPPSPPAMVRLDTIPIAFLETDTIAIYGARNGIAEFPPISMTEGESIPFASYESRATVSVM